MKSRTRLILLIGFGSLLILIGFLAARAFLKAEQLYADMSAIHDSYHKADAALDGIHEDVYSASILMRDFLLDPRIEAIEEYRNEFSVLRTSTEKHVAILRSIAGTADGRTLDRLQGAIDAYWKSRDAILDWTPRQTAEQGFDLLRKFVPLRQAVIRLTQEINDLNAANLRRERENIGRSQAEFRRHMGLVSVVILSLALFVAGISYLHISRLERNSEKERQRIVNAEREMRILSQRLVQAQEEERKAISRELHDEIGQMLTGLRLELRNLEELRAVEGVDFEEHLGEAKDLAEKALRSVRDLAMGLRPSMLDDLGLGAALQWQAREYSRRNGIPASVEVYGELEHLPDKLRTCVYRAVQESLTNCARHSRANSVCITVQGSPRRLAVRIQDDGVGFDPGRQVSQGIGLMGMEERVRELGGIMKISSQANKGTTLEISIPMAGEQAQ